MLYRLDQSTDYKRECLSDTRHEIDGFFDVVTIDYEAMSNAYTRNHLGQGLSRREMDEMLEAALGDNK